VNFIKYFLLSITIFFTAFSVWMAFISEDYQVSRTITIDAPIEQTFEQLSNLNTFPEWAIWFNTDSLNITIPGAASGLGAIMRFQDPNNSQGELRITAFEKYSTIGYELFYNGNKGAEGKWLFEAPNEAQTAVTWTFEGSMPFYLRWVNLTIDKRVGKDLETSLERAQQFVVAAP
jgi:uncharacterized membrane protein